MSEEKTLHILIKGLFSTIQNKWFLTLVFAGALLYLGWGPDDLAKIGESFRGLIDF